MDSFVSDILERIAQEAQILVKHCKRRTLTAKDVQTATRLILSGELAKHAVAKGFTAVQAFDAKQKEFPWARFVDEGVLSTGFRRQWFFYQLGQQPLQSLWHLLAVQQHGDLRWCVLLEHQISYVRLHIKSIASGYAWLSWASTWHSHRVHRFIMMPRSYCMLLIIYKHNDIVVQWRMCNRFAILQYLSDEQPFHSGFYRTAC